MVNHFCRNEVQYERIVVLMKFPIPYYKKVYTCHLFFVGLDGFQQSSLQVSFKLSLHLIVDSFNHQI